MRLGKGASIKRLEGGALIKRLKEAPMTCLGKREQGKNNLKILEKNAAVKSKNLDYRK